MRKNVGVIGLGIIGRRVVACLRKKGFPVFVWNRTPRPVPNFVGSPAELAQTCDIIQIFVSDDDALLRIVQQIFPKLTNKHIVIAHSTVSPDSMRAAAEIVEKRRAHFVEAPFTGSKLAAEKGELTYYVGGDPASIRTVRPVLEASSKAILEIGEVGDATIIKVATNMITAACVQAAAEAMAIVEGSGVSLDKFLTAMRDNASHSATLELKLPRMIAGDFEVHFSTKHMLKDMQIANRLARSGALELSVAAAARDRLLDQVQNGRADNDYSCVVRKYFPQAGIGAEGGQTLELFETSKEQPATVPPAEPEMPVASESSKMPGAEESSSTKGSKANDVRSETLADAAKDRDSTALKEDARKTASSENQTAPKATLEDEKAGVLDKAALPETQTDGEKIDPTVERELAASAGRPGRLRRWLRRPPAE